MRPDAPAHEPVQWAGTGLTHIGLVRTENQDAFILRNPLGLWIIADGMGGHPGGAEASRLAAASIAESCASGEALGQGTPDDEAKRLAAAIRVANHRLRERGRTQPELLGMGTTVVVLSIPPGSPQAATVAHVGDSRAYLLRDHRLIPLTEDHCLAQELARRGLLTPEAARTHPASHVLTRAVGIDPDVTPDVAPVALAPEDVLLLCTDGLTKMLDDGQILQILMPRRHTPGALCEALVREALQRGGHDNITVVVVTATQSAAVQDAG